MSAFRNHPFISDFKINKISKFLFPHIPTCFAEATVVVAEAVFNFFLGAEPCGNEFHVEGLAEARGMIAETLRKPSRT